MAQTKLAMMERYLIGGFAFFAEDGITIDEAVVDDETQPDLATDEEDIPSLGCIERVSLTVEAEDFQFVCPSPTGGYNRTTEKNVLQDLIDLQASKANELVHRLKWGLAAAVAYDTPQTPFADRTREALGWLYLRGVQRSGTTLLQAVLRAKVTLNEAPPWSNEPGRPVLRFEVQTNALNSIEFPDPDPA